MESEKSNGKFKIPKTQHRKISAIKSQRSDNNIIILPADKGNAIIVMDWEEYSKKLADLIEYGNYCKEQKNLNQKTKETLTYSQQDQTFNTPCKI